MAKNEAKIRFTAETGEFNNNIKKSNDEMAKLRAEMKLNAEQMKDTGTTVDGLQKKQQLLTSQLEATRAKTEAMSQKVEKAKQIFGENSTEVQKLETQLINQQTAQVKLERAVADCNAELTAFSAEAKKTKSETEKLSTTIDEQQSTLNDLKGEYADVVLEYGRNSKEAKTLSKEIKSLSGELSENKTKMNAAESAANKLDKSLEDAGDGASEAKGGFTVMKGALADLVSNGIQTAIGSINEFVGYLGSLPAETMEIRQDFATLETAFENVGFGAETATDTWRELYKVFGEDDRAVETANNIARMAKSQADLNSWVDITTGVWGTYQDSLPVEALAESAGETAKVGTVTGNLADALNWSSEAAKMFAGYMSEDVVTAEDAFNEALAECNTEQERQQLITETLTKLYGGAAATYRDTSGAMMEAKEATAEQIIAENNLADSLQPVTTEFTNLRSELLTELAPAITDVAQGFLNFTKWANENKAIVTAIASVFGVLTTAIIALNVVKAIKIAIEATETGTLWGLVAAQWAALAPILAIVAAIAAVIAIIVVVIKYWDEIAAAVTKAAQVVWESIKTAWDWIVNLFSGIGTWIYDNVISPVVDFFTGLWDGIVGVFQSVIDWVKSNWKSIVLFIINPFAGIFKYLYDNFEGFRNFVNNVVNSIKEFFVGLWNGIVNGVTTAWNWIVGIFSTAATWVYDNVIQPVINFFVNLWNGIVSAFHTVIDPWIEIVKRISVIIYDSVIKPIADFFVNLWNGIVTGLQEAWDWIVNLALTMATWVYDNVIQPIINFYVGLWNSITSGLQAAWDWIVNLALTVATWVNDNVIQPIINYFVNLWNGITNGLKAAWDWIVNLALTVSGWIYENVIQPIANFFVGLWNGITNGLRNAWAWISGIFSTVAGFVNEKVIQPVTRFFTNLWNGFTNGAKNAWQGVKNVFSAVGGFFSNVFNIVKDKIVSVFQAGGKVFNNIKEGIVNVFKTVVNGIIKGLNTVIKLPFQGLNKILDTIHGVTIVGVQPFSWLTWRAPVPQIPLLAEGGILNSPTLNIAGEAGPEAVIPLDRLQSFIDTAVDRSLQVNNLQSLVNAVEDLANRAIELNINGRQFATATASDTDRVNGNRMALSKLGLALG